LTGDKLWFKESVSGATGSRGARRKMMPEKYRKVFCNKQVVCVEYHEISEEDEREVFQVRSKKTFREFSVINFSSIESPTWHGLDPRR
jgi:hypothetical protein